MPDRASGGAISHADSIAAMNPSRSRRASGKCASGTSASGSRYDAIDATLTIAAPSGAAA